MDAVEVVARFGTTVLDTVVLDPRGRYRIGTAPGVDLPLELEPSIAVVERDLVRVPPGASATVFEAGRGRPVTGELRLGAPMRVELRLGRVTIAIRRIARPAPVPRAPIDRRRHLYDAASLVAHVVVVALAVGLVPVLDAPPRAPRPVRVARFPEAQPPAHVAPSPVPAATTAPSDPNAAPPPAEKVADVSTSRRSRAIARAREAGILGADGVKDLRGLATSDPSKAFEGVRPVYREEEAVARQFGGGESWDPGGIVPMGRFATKANAGADYELAGATPAAKTAVDVCTGRACTITGALSQETIVAVIDAHAEDLRACQERYAGARAHGVVSLSFDVDRDGSVLRPTADGMGGVAGCVLRAVQAIGFPTAPGDQQTEVALSIEFRDQ